MRNNIFSVALLAIFIAIFSACNTSTTNEHKAAWSYSGKNGPENWEKICSSHADCGGKRQSPVDIDNSIEDNNLSALEINWGLTSTNIINNGHTIQFNTDAGSSLVANGETYELKQFHYHALSEHTIKSNHYALEVHFVHQSASGGLAVIGVFFEEGEANDLFSKFLSDFPKKERKITNDFKIDLANLLPANKSYYHYSGSLTTPPCTEIVEWYVLQNRVTASAEQIEQFSKILHNNYRPVQPLNGRVIKRFNN